MKKNMKQGEEFLKDSRMVLTNGQEEKLKSKSTNRNHHYSKKHLKLIKETNERWSIVESSEKYRKYAIQESSMKATESLKDELMPDGMLVYMNERHCDLSEKKKTRILRRIVEKRQAQATHQVLGRTDNLYSGTMSKFNTRRCMMVLNMERVAI